MGESEAAAQAAAGPESAEATSPRPAIDAPGGDLVASAAALARLAARPIDASAAPPRVPGPTLSRHALALQRTAGNAATRRLLLRQPPGTLERPSYRLVPPSGTAWEIARWTRERVNAAEGRDIIAVLTASQILMFSAAASPKLIDTAPRSANEDDIKINSGVWRWNDPKMTPDFLETTKDLTIDGWAFAPYGQGGPENLAADAGKAKVKAMIPNPPGHFYLAYPHADAVKEEETKEEPVEPVVEDTGWATEQFNEAQQAIDDARTAAGEQSNASQTYGLPDRIVLWKRQDGKFYINVWVGTPSHGGEPMHHRSIELVKGDPKEKLLAQIRGAASELRTGLDPKSHVGVKGGPKGETRLIDKPQPGEISIPQGLSVDPTGGRKANAPAFPARIVSHGPEGMSGNRQYEHTVVGATVNFTMDLDFAAVTSGFWEEFGARFQVIAYRWELLDISNMQLDQVKGMLAGPTDADLRRQIELMKAAAKMQPDKEAAKRASEQVEELEKELGKRQKEPDSGAGRDIARDLANTWQDTKADINDIGWFGLLNPATQSYLGVIAISDLVQVGGALVGAGISEVASAVADKSVGFGNSGLFMLRCFAQPVITDEDIERITAKGLSPIIRAPSVAYLPIKVVPIHTRVREVNDADLAQIKALEEQKDNPPFPSTKEDVEARIATAKASLLDNNEEAIDRAVAKADEEIKRIDAWTAAQGTRLEDHDSKLRIWKATLDLSGIELDSYKQDLVKSIADLKAMRGRIGWHADKIKGRAFRPKVTLVSELDGRPYPIVANLGEGVGSKKDAREWHLIDVTTESSRYDYVGQGKTHAEAIRAAFQAFAENNTYGRGVIAIRLPDDPRLPTATDSEALSVPAMLVSAPGMEERAFKRLKDLATAAEIAGLFISGPLGVGLMVAGGVAGGLVALHNMQRRAAADRLKLVDFETAMDIVAVAGAVLAVGGVAAKGVQKAAEVAGMARLAQRGRMVAGVIHVMGVGMLAGQVVTIPPATVVQLQKIDEAEEAAEKAAREAGDPASVDRAKFRAQRLEAIVGAMKSILATARMVQLGADPSKGWDPFAEPTPKGAPPTPGAVKAAGAASGLPPELAPRVPVEVDPALGDSATVRVYYEVDPATNVIRGVRVRIGARATATDVGLHADTVRSLLRYSGLSGRVRVLWNQLMRMLGSTEPPEYSRAWEAKLELQKLPGVLKDRAAQMSNPKLTPERRAELIDELASLEEQVATHSRTVADMNIDPGRGFIAAEAPAKTAKGKRATGTKDPAGAVVPKSKVKKGTQPSGQPPPPVPKPAPGPPKNIGAGVSDARTAAMGGVESIKQVLNPFNEVETVIEGRLLEGMDRDTAPNYNREKIWSTLRKLHPELKLAEWEAAHLWGPGFGDEAAAGMMLAPKEVNQVWQNRGVEQFLRELRGIAAAEGWEIHVRAVARSHARTFAGGMGDSLMQSVQYDFSVGRPGGPKQPFGQVSFSVGTPPGGVVSEPVVTMF